MGRGDFRSLRALPRAFLDDFPEELPALIELPPGDADKFRKVLRLGTGDPIALLPGDGRLVKCLLEGKSARPTEVHCPQTEPELRLTVALGLPKPDALENAIRMGTELGVARFILFPADRTVVRWDAAKRESRLKRLRVIVREAAEVCFRTRLPEVGFLDSLDAVLDELPNADVLSEVEGLTRTFLPQGATVEVVIGPEGGWAPRELTRIGDRAVTLGPRVLRVDTAVTTACALALNRS